MNFRDKALLIIAVPTVAYTIWLFRQALGDWSSVGLAFTAMSMIGVVVGAVLLIIFGFAYYFTVWRAERYAEKLRRAGYKVTVSVGLVKEYAAYVLIAVMCTPLAIWLTQNQYGIIQCAASGDCLPLDASWYVFSVIILSAFWIAAVAGVAGAVSVWVRSFRPLRDKYRQAQKGIVLDLPRLNKE